jgi:hypothetical protein
VTVIYIQKTWLASIGDVAKEFLVREESDTYVSLLAGNVNVKAGSLFVEAQIVTKTDDEKRVVIPSHIPASVIIGIFDLTLAGEPEAYGFQSGKSA